MFNPLSDEVHRLNPFAAATLSELETAAMSLTTLSVRIAKLLEIEPGQDLLCQLHRILQDFDEVGLVSTSLPPSHPGTATSICSNPSPSG